MKEVTKMLSVLLAGGIAVAVGTKIAIAGGKEVVTKVKEKVAIKDIAKEKQQGFDNIVEEAANEALNKMQETKKEVMKNITERHEGLNKKVKDLEKKIDEDDKKFKEIHKECGKAIKELDEQLGYLNDGDTEKYPAKKKTATKKAETKKTTKNTKSK